MGLERLIRGRSARASLPQRLFESPPSSLIVRYPFGGKDIRDFKNLEVFLAVPPTLGSVKNFFSLMGFS